VLEVPGLDLSMIAIGFTATVCMLIFSDWH
jgi:hypothetical protein